MVLISSYIYGNFSGGEGDGNQWYSVMIVVDTSTPNQSSVVREASSCSDASIWQQQGIKYMIILFNINSIIISLIISHHHQLPEKREEEQAQRWQREVQGSS